MKFDTLNKKPKLYNLLILTGVFALAALVLGLCVKNGAFIAACFLAPAYFLIMAVLLFRAFHRQLRYNPYSYNTIFYFGFGLFTVFVFAADVVLSIRMLSNPELYDATQIVYFLTRTAKAFMLLSLPFITVFSAALCISNISLIRHERFRLVNILGIILSVLLLGGGLLLFFTDRYVSGSEREVMLHDLFMNVFASIYLYFECMIIGAIVANAIAARHEPEKNKDFLIVLGCGIRRDGTPTPLLRGRIDRAIAFSRAQEAETGKELIFVTSGGEGPNEPISESECMKNYLISQGIPESRIIEENASTDTFENMKFSKEKIMAANSGGKVAFATTNYHVFRSGLFARRVKMRAEGMGARTKWYFWPNAAVREFVGLLTQHVGKQAAILFGMIGLYVILTFLSYR